MESNFRCYCCCFLLLLLWCNRELIQKFCKEKYCSRYRNGGFFKMDFKSPVDVVVIVFCENYQLSTTRCYSFNSKVCTIYYIDYFALIRNTQPHTVGKDFEKNGTGSCLIKMITNEKLCSESRCVQKMGLTECTMSCYTSFRIHIYPHEKLYDIQTTCRQRYETICIRGSPVEFTRCFCFSLPESRLLHTIVRRQSARKYADDEFFTI